MAAERQMVFLGFGKFARATRSTPSNRSAATSGAAAGARGCGSRGCPSRSSPSRTERTILHDMGQDAAAQAPIVADALDLAERLVAAADAGRVDLGDLGRRARRLLEATSDPSAGGSE